MPTTARGRGRSPRAASRRPGLAAIQPRWSYRQRSHRSGPVHRAKARENPEPGDLRGRQTRPRAQELAEGGAKSPVDSLRRYSTGSTSVTLGDLISQSTNRVSGTEARVPLTVGTHCASEKGEMDAYHGGVNVEYCAGPPLSIGGEMGEPGVSHVAVVGCGKISELHLQAFRRLGVCVAWAVDTSSERREAAANRFGGRASAHVEDALADSEVDAVDLCLPHYLHAPMAIQALEAGKHVLCEKPLAISLEEADAMIEASEHAGKILMVGENVRYDPAFLKIRELIEADAVGAVSVAQITRDVWMTEEDLRERPWFQRESAAGGGIMMSGGIHDLEKARMLLGEISHISAIRAPQRQRGMEGDDTSIAIVRFTSGAIATIVESYSAITPVTDDGGELHTLRIDGSMGTITYQGGGVVRLFSSPQRARGSSIQETVDVGQNDTFQAEIAHFLHCVQHRQEPTTSGRSQRRPLELVLAAYQSMNGGGLSLIDVPAGKRRPTSIASLEAFGDGAVALTI
jgi:UDP-N-acetylglucosamine 3-dehydrogenase